MNQPTATQLLNIAQEHLDSSLTTLATRNHDRLDFHEVSVCGIVSALTAAYELGWRDGQKEGK